MIGKLHARRDEAAAKKDYKQLAIAREQIHTLKRRLRRMALEAAK